MKPQLATFQEILAFFYLHTEQAWMCYNALEIYTVKWTCFVHKDVIVKIL